MNVNGPKFIRKVPCSRNISVIVATSTKTSIELMTSKVQSIKQSFLYFNNWRTEIINWNCVLPFWFHVIINFMYSAKNGRRRDKCERGVAIAHVCVCVCMPAMMFRKQWVREPCPFWFGLLHFDQIGYVVYLQYFIFLLLLLLLLFVNAERNEHNQTKRTEKKWTNGSFSKMRLFSGYFLFRSLHFYF